LKFLYHAGIPRAAAFFKEFLIELECVILQLY